MVVCADFPPDLFLFCPAPWLARSLTVALNRLPVQHVSLRRRLNGMLPDTPCTVILVDHPPRHHLLQIGARLQIARSDVRLIYITAHVDLLRLYLGRACRAVGIIALSDTPTANLPYIVQHIADGSTWHSLSVRQLLENPPVLLSQLDALTPAQALVLVQTLEGAKPKHIARRLSCSIPSIYQHQARLRMRFGAASNTELVDLFRQPVIHHDSPREMT